MTNIATELAECFPLTDDDAAGLHSLQWSSGFGWRDDPEEWWHTPSNGPDLPITHDDRLAMRWLDDLGAIRRERLQSRKLDRAADLFDALAPFVEAFDKKADHGVWDLDNEQPFHVTVRLGDCRRAQRIIREVHGGDAKREPPPAQATPRVVDNDRDEITAVLDGREIRGWSYNNETERRFKILVAREFCEGWFQASKGKGR